MAARLSVGTDGVVHGQLPRGCRMEARYDRAKGLIEIDSPELHSFSIHVDIGRLQAHIRQAPEQKELDSTVTTAVLDDSATLLRAEYSAGSLRYSSPDVVDFWLEVDLKSILRDAERDDAERPGRDDAAKKQKVGSELDEAWRQWSDALACYTKGSAPPLAPHTREAFARLMPYMQQTIVYHDAQASAAMLQSYLRERLPCAMGRHILTDLPRMRRSFGFDAPVYRSLAAPPPMIGVFTRAPVRVGRDDVDLAIYHMIAPDLCTYADGSPTADLRALIDSAGSSVATERLYYEAARVHAIAWFLAFAAAREHGFTKLADVLVGGGAFVPEEWHDAFKVKVHDTALYLIGYGAPDFAYPEIELVPAPTRVPLRDATGWHDVLHVNAWCHSSFLGNGNRVDDTLDGAWGRSAPIAPFAWPLSNPWLQMRPVHRIPSSPPVRPPDRLCGKPPSLLRQKRP